MASYVIRCFTANQGEFSIPFSKRPTYDDLYDYVVKRFGDVYRCYTLENGTLRKIRANKDFQKLVDNNPIEVYVKLSKTLASSNAKKSQSVQLPCPPQSVPAVLEPERSHSVSARTNHVNLNTSAPVGPSSSSSRPPHRRGHRRSNTDYRSLYIPETHSSQHGYQKVSNGGHFVPTPSPDSGFQSPDMFVYESSGNSKLATNSDEIPRHLIDDTEEKEAFVDSRPSSSRNFGTWGRRHTERSLSMSSVVLPENLIPKKLIGKGGFAKVYHCIDKQSGRDLAVKQVEYDPGCRETTKELKALKLELDILKQLNHPRIVIYLGSCSEPGVFSIFMEFVMGGSLRSYIQSNGPLSIPFTRRCLYDMLQGLSYLHSKNVLHRDLKAANVLKTPEGRVKIADFGAAKRFELLKSLSTHCSVVGTPYWMSPEIIMATGWTEKVDVWGIGVTAIEFLTGDPPFYSFEPMAAMFRIANRTLKSEVELPENVPIGLKSLIWSCLEKESNKRPSVEELLLHEVFRD